MIIFPLLMLTLQGVIWTKLSDTSFGCPCGVDKNTKFSNHEEKQIGKARIVGWLVLLRLVRIFLYSRKDLSMSLTTSSSMAVITITTTSSEAVMLTIPTPPSCTSDMSCLMAGSTSFSDNIVSVTLVSVVQRVSVRRISSQPEMDDHCSSLSLWKQCNYTEYIISFLYKLFTFLDERMCSNVRNPGKDS